VTATDWIVIGGGALVGWGLVSWIITTVRQQRAPPVPMGPESSQAPAPEPTPAPPRGRLSLAELGSTWHMILGVSPNASLAEIEAVYEKRVAECERGGARLGTLAAR
jgi:hypothetical protein